MKPDASPRPLHRRAGLLAAGVLLAALAGCATRLDSEWRDPQYRGSGTAGAKVLVACGSSDESVRRLCEDKLAAGLRAKATATVLARDVAGAPTAAGAEPQAYLAAARSAGATSVLFTRVAPSSYSSGSRSSVGIGLGGFGGGNVGFGVGVGIPIGERTPETVLVANATLLEAGGGRTVWAGSATARSARDIGTQLDSLAQVLVDGVQKAGVL